MSDSINYTVKVVGLLYRRSKKNSKYLKMNKMCASVKFFKTYINILKE